MINKIVVSRIEDAYSKSFLQKNEINKVISFLDPNFVDNMWTHYKYNIQLPWEYYVFIDTEHSHLEDVIAPRYEHIERLIDTFIGLISKTEKVNLLLHCTAGISRSPAAALILLYLIERNEKTAMDELLKIRKIATPNLLMLDYADKILKSNLSDYVYKWKEENRKFGKILLP